MARPWDFPVGSAISHTNHSAAPGGQSAIIWLVTTRLAWSFAAVPSTARPPTAAGRVGKLTFNTGMEAVRLVEKGAAAVGSMKYENSRVFGRFDWRHTSPVNCRFKYVKVFVVSLINLAPKAVNPVVLVANKPR